MLVVIYQKKQKKKYLKKSEIFCGILWHYVKNLVLAWTKLLNKNHLVFIIVEHSFPIDFSIHG